MSTHAQLTEGSRRAHSRKGREGKGRENGLRLHANLTVGAPDAPAISRPDVADVGMPIEHLDFEIACDARWGHEETGPPPAEWIVYLGGAPCSCAPLWRYFCDDCLAYERGEMWSRAICPDCGAFFKRTLRWEPLR